jgi:hypothetical protein
MQHFDPFSKIRNSIIRVENISLPELNDFRSKIFMSDLQSGRLDWILSLMEQGAFGCVESYCWKAFSRYLQPGGKKEGRPHRRINMLAALDLTSAYNSLVQDRTRMGGGPIAERLADDSTDEYNDNQHLIKDCFGMAMVSKSTIRKTVDSINLSWKKAQTQKLPISPPENNATEEELLAHSETLHKLIRK